jgi:hypothetical protein
MEDKKAHPVEYPRLVLGHGTPRAKPGSPAMSLVPLDVLEQVRLLSKQHAPRHHHIHDAPERPPVHLKAVAWTARPWGYPRTVVAQSTADELGRSIAGREHGIASIALASRQARGVVYVRRAQVGNPHITGAREKDVLRLEVTVHDAHVVECVEAKCLITQRVRKSEPKDTIEGATTHNLGRPPSQLQRRYALGGGFP